MFEFVIVEDGEFNFQVDENSYSVKGNDVFVAFPNEVHSTAKVPLSNGTFYWLQIDEQSIDNLLFLESEASNHLLNQLKQLNRHYITSKSNDLINLCKNAFDACVLSNDKYVAAAGTVLLLYKIIHYSKHSEIKITNEILAVVDYINKNCDKNIEMQYLSDISHLSISHFKAKFKSQLGISPRNYINKKKIELAKQYLKQGLTVTDTAMKLQFDTSTYFSVVFKKYTTMSPNQYRITHLNS